jgi:hypothetical protein
MTPPTAKYPAVRIFNLLPPNNPPDRQSAIGPAHFLR